MGCCAASKEVVVPPSGVVVPASDEETSSKRRCYTDQAFLIDILRTQQVRLLKAEFIVDWWDRDLGPLPCRQSVPEDGFLDICKLSEEDLERLAIISVSYCWVHWDHPDPDRYHLETLAEMLRCFCSSSWDSTPDMVIRREGNWPKEMLKDRGMCPGAGDGRPVGVFVDWTGLYQDKPEGTRTPEQNVIFKNALKDINVWYAHLKTIVWMLTSLPPEVERKSYHESGWTTFEAIVGGVLTRDTNLLDITGDTREAILTEKRYDKGDYLRLSLDTASAKHRVPLSPEDFNKMIEEKKFTSGSDMDTIVKPKYKNTFEDLVPSLSEFSASGVSFTSDQVHQTIRLARTHVPELQILDLSSNDLIDVPLADFAELKRLRHLRLDLTQVHGDVRDLNVLVNLTKISLSWTNVSGDVGTTKVSGRCRCFPTKVSGDVGALSALDKLTLLCLDGTKVSGDISSLSVLKELTDLHLNNTQVSGDISSLSVLKELTKLYLFDTHVSGDIGSLSVLKELTDLYLFDTQVSGDIGSLSELKELTKLGLQHTQVSGDISSLSELKVLTDLRLSDTQVSGDVSRLSVLKELTVLILFDTHVSGDIGSLSVLKELTVLFLSDTQVSGDIGSLSELKKLECLGLQHTQVSGDISSLSVLKELTKLYLDGTQVSGDVGALSVLKVLNHLRLRSTQVSGDVSRLSVLKELTVLFLSDTQVSGDVGWLSVLKELTNLFLSDTQVSGDVGSLSVLEKLECLGLDGTQVSGDIDAAMALVQDVLRSRVTSSSS